MIRKYKNHKIYTNFKVASILYTAALLVAIIAIIIYTIINLTKNSNAQVFDIVTSILLITLFPLNGIIFSLKALQKPTLDERILKENKWNNDLSSILAIIILTYAPTILSLIMLLFSALLGSFKYGNLFISMLYSFPMPLSHIVQYVASSFLIYSYILIKKEWQEDLPAFMKENQLKKQNKRNNKILTHNNKEYERLIQQCGIKFFIKYYNQISNLPLKDINIEEDYPFEEKTERLIAAKKIIDLNLTKFTITKILQKYDNFLNEEERLEAQNILKTV